jgi:hypothetical protein
MTRLAKRLSLVVIMVLASAGVGQASELRTPSYRPYITEVGPPRTLSLEQFEHEVQANSDLRSWVKDYGYPDVAETQEVVPEYGWSDYEVRAYYFDRDQELAFGRIALFPQVVGQSMVDRYGLVKYQGRIQPENRKRVLAAARLCPSGGTSLDRILAAADRATRAAEVAEKESMRALQAAERAEAVVSRMEAGFQKGLRK